MTSKQIGIFRCLSRDSVSTGTEYGVSNIWCLAFINCISHFGSYHCRLRRTLEAPHFYSFVLGACIESCHTMPNTSAEDLLSGGVGANPKTAAAKKKAKAQAEALKVANQEPVVVTQAGAQGAAQEVASEVVAKDKGAAGDQVTSECIDLHRLPDVAEHIMRKISLRKVIPQTSPEQDANCNLPRHV